MHLAVVGPYGQRTELILNADGYLESIQPDASEPPYVLSYHDEQGLLASFRNPRGAVGTFSYDALGRLETDTDAAGATISLDTTEEPGSREVVESSGEERQTRYFKQAFDTGVREQRVTQPDGSVNVLTYDRENARTTVLADGTRVEEVLGEHPLWGMQLPLVTTTTRLPVSGLTSVVSRTQDVELANELDPSSVVSRTETVVRNGKTWTSVYSASPTKTVMSTSPEGRVVTGVLDAEGRLSSLAVVGLHPVVLGYDADGRLSTLTQGSGVAERTVTAEYWSDSGEPERAGYLRTLSGPVVDEDTQLPEMTTFTPDVMGRPLSIERADGEVTAMSYDGVGNVETVTPPGKPAHELTYTDVSLTDTYTSPEPEAGAGVDVTDHDYNLDREPVLTTLADGRSIAYEHDTDASGAPLLVKKGQLTRVVTDGALITYGYYPTNPGSGYLQTATRSDAQGSHTLGYTYDGGWLKTVTWSGEGNVAGSVERVPDSDFRVDQLNVNGTLLVDYVYDRDGLMTSASGMIISRRADNGILSGTTLGSVTTAQTVTGFGELDLMSASYAGTVRFEEDIVTRDALGRIREKSEVVAATGGGLDTASYVYSYDPAGRLTDATVSGSEHRHYAFDANGNRRELVTSLGTVVGRYDMQDRLLSYCPEDMSEQLLPTPGLPCFRYEYRDSGSLLSKTDVATNDVTMYDYDELGNLLSVALPDGRLIEYEVDPQHRRVGRSVTLGAVTTVTHRWLYGNQLEPIAELNASNAVVAGYVYGTKPHVPDYMVKGGVTYRIVSDHLGSVRLVVEQAHVA